MKILLDVNRDICLRHLEPLRDHWPEGAECMILLLFDAFCQDERTIAMAPKCEHGDANPEGIPNLILECSPICCFLGDDVTAEITAESLLGHPGPRLLALLERQKHEREQNQPPA